MNETPHNSNEDPEGHQSTTMTEFAKETGRNFLTAYIEKTRELYKKEGLTDESFVYFPDTKTVEIQYIPSREQEGHDGVNHGGKVWFMIDASAGSLGMAVAKPDEVAMTTKANIENMLSVITGKPTRVVSTISPDKNGGSKRQVFVKTEVIQDGVVCVSAEVECMVGKPDVLERARQMRANTN